MRSALSVVFKVVFKAESSPGTTPCPGRCPAAALGGVTADLVSLSPNSDLRDAEGGSEAVCEQLPMLVQREPNDVLQPEARNDLGQYEPRSRRYPVTRLRFVIR